MAGFSLIEVLISLLILALILLGVDAVEMFSFRENRNAYYLSIAENQLKSMIEQLNEQSSLDELNQSVILWNQENDTLLPFGKGFVVGTYPKFKLTIFWGDKTNKQICNKFSLGKLKCLTTQVEF